MPSLKLPAGFLPSKLSRVTLSGKNTIVSLSRAEFGIFATELQRINPTIGQIMPGEWVGPISLKARGNLTDVIWNGVVPFFSDRLVAAARQA
ncbi:MAG TPA: hypothetical protein VEC99_14640, partial [Clostridia bacterium]|nr:hypothetical protein [Clostridia bacterium]